MGKKLDTKIDGRKLIKLVLAGFGIVIIVGYSYFVLEDFARGPRILISSPINGFPTTTPTISIVGRAIHTNNLTINDGAVPVDLQGNFRAQLILAPGYNIIKVAAKDNYARSVEKILEINLIVKKEELGSLPSRETSVSTTTTTVAPEVQATTTPIN